MNAPKLRHIVAVIAIGVAVPRAASAEPMFIELTELSRQASAIYRGVFISPVDPTAPSFEHYEFFVTEVLRGEASTGLHSIPRSAHGTAYLPTGVECVAFLDREGAFHWVARADGGRIAELTSLITGPEIEWDSGVPLEEGILRLEGFYDFNAYIVEPSLITYDHLLTFLETGSYELNVIGPLQVFSAEEGGPSYSGITVELTVDPIAGIHNVTPIEQFAGFTTEPDVTLGSSVGISWETNLSGHPLVVRGHAVRYDSVEHIIHARFAIVTPHDVNRLDDLEMYLADPSANRVFYRIGVVLEDGREWELTLGHEGGRIGVMTGLGDRTYSLTSLYYDQTGYRIDIPLHGNGWLHLDLAEPPAELTDHRREERAADFFQTVLAGPLGCEVRFEETPEPMEGMACHLEIREVGLAE